MRDYYKKDDNSLEYLFEKIKSIWAEKALTAKREKLQTQYSNPNPDYKIIRIYYQRYADDFILFLKGSMEDAEHFKNLIAESLKVNLGLTLSVDKTKITDLRKEKAQFLGFEIFRQKNPYLKNTIKGEAATQRFNNIQVHPDIERLENKFKLKNLVDGKGRPREIGYLTVLQDHEIITKFNQFIIGLCNYYIRSISYPSRLNRWIYILYYSCIKTLATKHRLSVRKVISKYGFKDLSDPNINLYKLKATDLRIAAKYKTGEEEKWTVLHNYKETMFLIKKLLTPKPKTSQYSQVTIDFMKLNKFNTRTKFKEQTCCTICGSGPPLCNHHIKPIKHKGGKFTGYRGFDKLVASLGRKQITVCYPCHNEIHKGTYKGMSLEHLHDIRLVAPEGLLKLLTKPSTSTPKSKSGDRAFIINEKDKTYFNASYNRYLLKKAAQQ